MKKVVLLVSAMLVFAVTAEAKTFEINSKRLGYKQYTKVHPIVFEEKNIQFIVNPNGDFRFKKMENSKFYSNYGYAIKNRNLKIKRDFNGRIKKVGNVSIFYKPNGKIAAIGKVKFNYNKGLLVGIGHLKIIHKRNGTITYIGNVKSKRIYPNTRRIVYS